MKHIFPCLTSEQQNSQDQGCATLTEHQHEMFCHKYVAPAVCKWCKRQGYADVRCTALNVCWQNPAGKMDSVGGAILLGGKKKNVIKCGRIVFYSTRFLKTLWSAATNLSGYKCGKSPPIILPLTRSINGPSLPTANTGLSALHRRPPPIPALSFYIKLHHTLLKRLSF